MPIKPSDESLRISKKSLVKVCVWSAMCLVMALFTPGFVFSQQTRAFTIQEETFSRAVYLFGQEKYGAAKKLFEDYLSVEGPSGNRVAEAEYYAAYCALFLRNADGEKAMLSFVNKYPFNTLSYLANYQLGAYYFTRKDYPKTVYYLSRVEQEHVSEEIGLETSFKLAYAYMSTKELEKAAVLFNQIKSGKHAYTYAANYYSGYLNLRNGKYDESRKDLTKSAENEAYKPLVPPLMTQVFFKQKKYAELLDYAKPYLSGDNKSKSLDEISFLAAEASYQLSRFQDAVGYYERFRKEGGLFSPETSYKYAISKFRLGDYKTAIENFKKGAERNDTLGQFSAYYLGLSWLKQSNKPFAYNAFYQASRMNFSSQIKAQAMFEYAKTAYELEKYSDAISTCKEYLLLYPEDDDVNEVNSLLSESYLNTSNYNEAIKHIESLKTRSTRDNKAYQVVTFQKGSELFNEEKFAEALQYFDKSLEWIFDKDLAANAAFWAGEALSINRRYTEATGKYALVFKYADASHEIYHKAVYGIAYTYFNTKEYEKALPHFKSFADHATQFQTSKKYRDDALIRTADCFYTQKKYKEALEYYEKARENNPVEIEYVYFQKGIILGITGKTEEAQHELLTLVQTYPATLYLDAALYNIGLLDFESGQYQKSVGDFEKLLNNPSLSQSQYIPLALQKRAIAYSNMEMFESSAADYRKILQEYPSHKVASAAVSGLKDMLSRLGREDSLGKDLERFKEANPQDSQVESLEFEQGKDLYFSQKYNECINKLMPFISRYPSSVHLPDAEYFLGDCYLKTGNNKLAKKYLDTVVTELRSDYVPRALQRLGDIHLEEKEYYKAIEYYLHLVQFAKSKKEVANAWSGLMVSYFEVRNFDSCIYFANAIIKQGGVSISSTSKALLYTGKSYEANEEFDKAVDYFLSAINTAHDQYAAEAMYQLADVQYQQKKYPASLETLFNLTKDFGNYKRWYDKAYVLLADNYLAMNELYQAKATLASVIEKSEDKEIVKQAKEKLAKLN